MSTAKNPILAVLFTVLFLNIQAQTDIKVGQEIKKLSPEFISIYPDQALTAIDSLLVIVRASADARSELELLEKRRSVPRWSYQSGKVLQDLDRQIRLSRKLGITQNLAELYTNKATFTARLGKTEEAVEMLDSAEMYMNVLPEEKQRKLKTQGYYLKGRILDRAGRLEEAMDFYLKTIEEAEKIDASEKIMDVYFQLGFIHKALIDYEQAITNYERSLTYSIELQDTTYIVYNYVFIAGALLESLDASEPTKRIEKIEEARQKLQIAADLAINRQDPYELELLYFEFSNYHEAISQFDSAITYIMKSREESRKAENLETEMAGYAQAAQCYYKAANFSKAIEEAQFGIALSNKIAAYYYLSELYEIIAKAAESLDNLPLSYEYFKKYVEVRDSIFKEESAKTVNLLQTKYETEKKQAEIEDLRQQAQIQALELSQRNQTLYFTIIASVLLLLIATIIYRQKGLARKRKQEEIEHRFLRSQLNPHFMSNALVGIQSTLLQKKTEDALSYLSRFSRLMREILENSREEFIALEDELEMLQDYLELNRLRLDGAFEYEIHLDSSVDPEVDTIPPMYIQPFVENAIEHGLNPDKKGKISIHLHKTDNRLTVVIKDNGPGFNEDNSIGGKKRSLSTSIIEERMRLFNQSLKSKIQLLIENWHTQSGEVGGTNVELQIPVR